MARVGTSLASPLLGDQFVSLYLGDERVATVPDAPSISVAVASGGGTQISFTPSANDGGESVTAYKMYIDGVEEEPDEAVDGGTTFVYYADDYAGQVARVTAVNSVGESRKSAPFTVP